MNLLCSPLFQLGWEFDNNTGGVHFLMLTSEEDGIGYDVTRSKDRDTLKVQKFTFFLSKRGVEIEDEPIQYMTVPQLVALTLETLEFGYEPGEFGF